MATADRPKRRQAALGKRVTLISEKNAKGQKNFKYQISEKLEDLWTRVRDRYGLSDDQDFSIDTTRLLDFIQQQADNRKKGSEVFGSTLQDEINAKIVEIFDAVADMYSEKTGQRFSLNIEHKQVTKDGRYDKVSQFEEHKYFAGITGKMNQQNPTGYTRVGEIKEGSLYTRIGLPAGTTYFDNSKILKELNKKHDPLPVEYLKQVPEILSHPTVIVEAEKANTVSVFGEIRTESGAPILVGIMAVKDDSGRNVITKVRTVHPRLSDLSSLITDTSVLYITEDKKKAKNWFQTSRIEMPLSGTKFGFIRSIALSSDLVNKFSLDTDSIREARQAFTVIDTAGIEDGLEALKGVKNVGAFAMKDISRFLDAISNSSKDKEANKNLRNTLSAIFEKPHSEATGRYARGVERMQQRVLDIGAKAGVCDKKGGHFDSQKNGAVRLDRAAWSAYVYCRMPYCLSRMAAWAAARRAMGTRKGLQDT